MPLKDKLIKAVSDVLGPIASDELHKAFKSSGHRCPCCTRPVEYNSPGCQICGSNFKLKRDPRVSDTYDMAINQFWVSGKPEIDDTIKVDGIGHRINKPFSEVLSEHNLSEERYFELFSSISTIGDISPNAFLVSILYGYYSSSYYKRDIQASMLGELMSYVASKLSRNINNIEDMRGAVSKIYQACYDSCYIDYCINGGWLPIYDYPVSVDPFVYPSDESPTFAMSYDILAERSIKDKKYADNTELGNLCCFNIALSSNESITSTQMEQIWSSLQGLSNPVVFEIIGDGSKQKIVFQLLCHPDDKTRIVNQLQSAFPDTMLNLEGNDYDYLAGNFGDNYREKFISDYQAYGSAFGLERHYSWMLRSFSSFDKTDPLSSLMTPLSELERDEGAVIQSIIYPANSIKGKQLENIAGLVKYKRDFYLKFGDCPAQQKLKYPLFTLCIRAMSFGKKELSDNSRLKSFALSVENAFMSFSSPEDNSLKLSVKIPDSMNVPDSYRHVKSDLNEKELLSVLERKTYRHGFILNSRELASVCHFPSNSLNHPKLLRQETNIGKAPDAITSGNGLLVGVNEVFSQSQMVYVPEDFRFRHIYVVGKTGTGKTTLLLNMIKADIDAGKGVGLIDPHGDLVESIMRVIPEERIDDVILFDPTDHEYPIGFNMFQVSDRMEERQMRSDIVIAIKRLFDSSSWGDNIDYLFRTAVATLLADGGKVHTILDIRKLISDDVFRSQVLRRIEDEYLKEFWTEDFPAFTQSTISAVKRRLASILGESEVRDILGQQKTSFNFKDMMDTKKIFLANLSKGILGDSISSLFGGILVSKIQLTALSRASQPEEERVPFYLYVDEFQNFVNESFEIILSEARKYKLCLTIAHQFTGQLPTRLYDAVFGNVGTLIVFEVGVDDATVLEKQLGKFSRDDIINLDRFHTFTRVGKARESFSMRTLPPFESGIDFSERARKASRDRYCIKIQPEKAESVSETESEDKEAPDAGNFFEK